MLCQISIPSIGSAAKQLLGPGQTHPVSKNQQVVVALQTTIKAVEIFQNHEVTVCEDQVGGQLVDVLFNATSLENISPKVCELASQFFDLAMSLEPTYSPFPAYSSEQEEGSTLLPFMILPVDNARRIIMVKMTPPASITEGYNPFPSGPAIVEITE